MTLERPSRLPSCESIASDTTGVTVQTSDGTKLRRRRQANVYDAVAGRISLSKRMRAEDAAAGIAVPRDVPALAPHEVLLRRRGVPRSLDQEGYAAGLEEMLTRWAESHRHRDGEDSDEGLGPLPDSDLLKAVHRYVAHFYAAGRGEAPDIDSRSMDETALLAFGVLLEEAAREALGETGDLALVEGEEEEVGGQRHAGGAEDAAGPRGVVLPNRPRGRPPKRRRIWIGTGHIRGAEGRM